LSGPAFDQAVGDGLHRFRRERLQGQGLNQPVAAQPAPQVRERMVAGRLFRAVRPHEQRRTPNRVAHEIVQKVEAGGVGPVQVVEEDDHGPPAPGQRVQPAQHGLEQPLPRRFIGGWRRLGEGGL
jgi:hypothetical protein